MPYENREAVAPQQSPTSRPHDRRHATGRDGDAAIANSCIVGKQDRKERVRRLCPYRPPPVFGHFIGSLRCPRGRYRGVGTEWTSSNLVNHHQFAEGKNTVPDPGTDSVESRRLQARRREDQSLRDCAVILEGDEAKAAGNNVKGLRFSRVAVRWKVAVSDNRNYHLLDWVLDARV